MSDPTPAEKAEALGIILCSTVPPCWMSRDCTTHYSPDQLDAAYAALRRDGIAALTEALTDPRDAEIARLRGELADARRLGASIHKAAARAVEQERASVVRLLRGAADDHAMPMGATHDVGDSKSTVLDDLADLIASGAHRTDDPLPSAIEAAREEGRREERARNVTALRERAATRRATADRMFQSNQHKDAATYYLYATAEECCATLIEKSGDAAKEPK